MANIYASTPRLKDQIQEAIDQGYSKEEVIQYLSENDAQIKEAMSEGYSPDEIITFVSGKEPLTTREVVTGAVKSFPSSFAGLVQDLVTAVTNPIDTAKSVLDLGAGILQNVLPESVVQTLGEDPQSRQVANQVGQFYVDRYGSLEGAKRAIAEDPAGVLADVSTIFTGGSTIAPRAVAAPLKATARAIDPLAVAARATGKVASNVVGPMVSSGLGVSTGTGSVPIQEAFRAGREGGARAEQFTANLRGQAPMLDVLEAARQNLNDMFQQRSNVYRSGMINISKDKTVLKFDGIDKAISDAEKRTRFGTKLTDEVAADAISKVKDIVDDWKASDPAVYRTPEGLDALKQKIGAELDKLEPNKNPYATVNKVYNSVKSEIVKQAPVYANTMREYTRASEQLMEIKRALSLDNKASKDTALRKLQSLMRDNVQTNYGLRRKLGEELEASGGRQFIPGLAGQALSDLAPRGISRAIGGSLGGYFALTQALPQLAATALASSPRVVGESAYGLGRAAAGGRRVAKAAPFIVNPELYNLIYQSGQMQGLLGD